MQHYFLYIALCFYIALIIFLLCFMNTNIEENFIQKIILEENFIQMSNILERIIQISDNEKITISKIERIIGASKGVLHKAIQNKTDISSKWVVLIVENFTHYNSEWLLTGKGNMIRGLEDKKAEINPMAEKDNYIIELQKKEIATLEEKLQQCQDEKKLIENSKFNV